MNVHVGTKGCVAPECRSLKREGREEARQSGGAAVPSSQARRGPSRLCGPAWTQGHRALLKSTPTKTPLRSVKINYFGVFFTSTPPAFPSLPRRFLSSAAGPGLSVPHLLASCCCPPALPSFILLLFGECQQLCEVLPEGRYSHHGLAAGRKFLSALPP